MAPQPNPVSELVRLFGGMKHMLGAINQRWPTIVYTWQRRGSIPRWRGQQIEAAAKRLGVPLSRVQVEAALRPHVHARRPKRTPAQSKAIVVRKYLRRPVRR